MRRREGKHPIWFSLPLFFVLSCQNHTSFNLFTLSVDNHSVFILVRTKIQVLTDYLDTRVGRRCEYFAIACHKSVPSIFGLISHATRHSLHRLRIASSGLARLISFVIIALCYWLRPSLNGSFGSMTTIPVTSMNFIQPLSSTAASPSENTHACWYLALMTGSPVYILKYPLRSPTL